MRYIVVKIMPAKIYKKAIFLFQNQDDRASGYSARQAIAAKLKD
jgi:hypothetical protein